jgi:aldehyde dehydrogenase (NAD+)
MIDKTKFYINGNWVDPVNKNDCNVIDPSTEEPYVTISLGSADDTNKVK